MKPANSSLAEIRGASTPGYDRSKLTPGIVHIGLGNFHRAHQAWYLHRLMEMGLAHDWGIIGAGVRPADREMRERLAAQDHLYTLIELDPGGRSAEIVGSIIGFAPVEEANTALIAQMADPAIRIVSLTVTEGGYYIDPATKGFDAGHPDIAHDAANPGAPRTAFGAIVAALGKRREAGLEAFTCQSCDNLQGNGAILKQAVLSLARMSDPGLAEWIGNNAGFPNSMVDCIVPATGEKELALARGLGIDDAVPVTHENFRQWVVEDDFRAGRPEWEKVGATLGGDVHAFETMKIRILNGGHQVIAAAGDLLGIETISGCMEHPLVRGLYTKVEREEIVPHVGAVPGMEPGAYAGLIERRFSNPEIYDTTRRVAFDGSSRQPGFVLPSARDCLAKGIGPSGLALVSAIWARYCSGAREDGSPIEANDPNWGELTSLAGKAKEDPGAWLANKAVYGGLGDEAAFAGPFAHWLATIHERGLGQVLEEYLGN